MDPYYIVPKDYDYGRTATYEINGNTFYFNDYDKQEGEINSYHYFPGTCYRFMIDRSTLITEDIRDGFIAK